MKSSPKMRSLATQTPTRVPFHNKKVSGASDIRNQTTINSQTPISRPQKRYLSNTETPQFSPFSVSNITPRSPRNTTKERTRKPPSASTRDNQDSQNEGFFYEKLQQREENLAKEKRKLELAKLKLHADFEELERLRRNLEEEENEISGFNQQMMKDQSQLGKQSLYLKKMESDLRKQIEIAELELEGMKQNDHDPKALKEIANQQIRVDKLHELMDLMQNEILTRENDVIQMELAAVDHKKNLEKTEKLKKELDARMARALSKKQQLMELTSIRQSRIDQMESSFQAVKKQLINAQAERDRLNELSRSYDLEEAELKAKSEDLARRRSKLDENQKARIALQKEVREELEIRERLLAEHPIDPSFDLDTFQMEVEKEEKDLQESILRFETRHNQTISSLQTKKDKLTDDINTLKNEINSGKSLEELQKELLEAQRTSSESRKVMDEKNKEIEELKSKILSEAEINQRMEENKAETKRIMALERELNSLLSRIQTEEDQLEGDEESIKQARGEIESERRMLQLKEDAANKMINIYKQQYEQAAERYQTLVQQVENLNKTNEGIQP